MEEMRSRGREAVLTSPLSVEEEKGEEDTGGGGGGDGGYRPPSAAQRILGLLIKFRPGADLTRLQLPPQFNIPKSQLQCYGELVYSDNADLLSKCANGGSPLDRFNCVVAWHISTVRPLLFGVAPYNPILGETHHVSKGNLNVLLEQVSHHPPVSALHATDESLSIETIWYHYAIPKFKGTYIEVEMHGQKELKLLNMGETYVMNSPNMMIRLLPIPGVEWLGNVVIRCKQTGLEAKLSYKGNSFLGCHRSSNHRSVKGKIFKSSAINTTISEISGHWDKTVMVKDIDSGKVTEIYNAKQAISGLKTPIVQNPEGVWGSESAVVWGEVSKGILKKKWDKAGEAKSCIEEEERKLLKKRASNGQTWQPKHFTLSYSKQSGWECSPIQTHVPPAPILVPL